LSAESVRADSTMIGAESQPRRPPITSMPEMSGRPRSRMTTSGCASSPTSMAVSADSGLVLAILLALFLFAALLFPERF